MKWTCAYLNVIICLVAWSFWKTVVFATVWSCHFLRNSGTNSREAQCFLKFPTEWHNQYGFAQFPCATKRYENSNVQKKNVVEVRHSETVDGPKRNELHASQHLLHLHLLLDKRGNGTRSPLIREPPTMEIRYHAIAATFSNGCTRRVYWHVKRAFPAPKELFQCNKLPWTPAVHCFPLWSRKRIHSQMYRMVYHSQKWTPRCPIPCSDKRRKTTENAGEPNAWSPNHKE